MWLSWHCIVISRFPANFQDRNGPLLNTTPLEVIKAAYKIFKQASDKGGILIAQHENILFFACKAMLLRIPAWGWGSPCGYDATSLFANAILHAFTIIFQYECAFSSMRAVKILVVGICTKIKPSKFSSPAFLRKFRPRNLPIIRYKLVISYLSAFWIQ